MDFRTILYPRGGAVKRSEMSLADPALAAYLGIGGRTASGIHVTPVSAMSLTAVYRSVALIAGTIASLPLKTYREVEGIRQRIPSWLDAPGGVEGPTPYEWIETLVASLLLHGNGYGPLLRNGAGTVAGVQLLDPLAVTVEWSKENPGERVYKVARAGGDGPREFAAGDFLHVPAMVSGDGRVGMSPIQVTRDAIGTGIAGDRAAGRIFANGLMVGGLVTSEDDMEEEEAAQIKKGLMANATGVDRAGDIAVVNRKLRFEKWTMTAEDAQFIEARKHQVEEVARIFGVPKVLLAEDGASSWGSGIAELVRGMARFTLAGWTSRIEQRLSRLLPRGQYCEFDYAGLLAPTPTEAVESMAREIEVGLLTPEEGRKILNRGPAPAAPSTPPEEG